MNRRIAFAGASGTGKSTLAVALSQHLQLPVNPVGSRSVAASLGFLNPYDVDRASLESYERLSPDYPLGSVVELAMENWRLDPSCRTVRSLFQAKLQTAKIDWENAARPPGYVSDRTTMDDMAYALLHCPSVVDRAFIKRAREHLREYTHVIFCPLDSFYAHAGDPARVSDIEYHYRYEAILRGLLADERRLNIMPHSDRDDRITWVKHIMEMPSL
ncbi:Fer4_NifH domain containing protein [uncultured Caudovirales phage]|uniref:Fer4_NifH domain containing protein n=1 Tax=uncultured Caudovirales phage TaxID=2100421 RepID=A0A6J5RXH9_9CAUD|nr:Fer4_NifH domain containing protein [uncultured Caudovirales phage]